MFSPHGWTFTIREHDTDDVYFQEKLQSTFIIHIPTTDRSNDNIVRSIQELLKDSEVESGYTLTVSVRIDEHGASGFAQEALLIIAAYAFGKLADPLWEKLEVWARRAYEKHKETPYLSGLLPEQRLEVYRELVQRTYAPEGELELVEAHQEASPETAIYRDTSGRQYNVQLEFDGIGVRITTVDAPS